MTRPASFVFVLGLSLALAAGGAVSAHQPGLVVSWGDNLLGQCDVPEPNLDYVHLACGLQHSLGLKADGTLVAWGYNGWGQCDTPEPNQDWVDMAGGGQHSLGLKADGTILAWGDNNAGQCNLPEPNGSFVEVAAGSTFSLGLKADGTLLAWGANDIGQLNIPQPNSDYIKVTAGYFHALALRADGTLVGWGANQSHQAEIPAPNADFVDMAAGLNHSVALRSDGTVVAWGLNTSGQCNVPLPNSGYVAVAAGWFHSMALREDGTLVAWGNNGYGQANEPNPDSKFLSITSGGWHNLAIQQPPACALDAESLDFGRAWTGAPVTRQLTITNLGGGHLTGTLTSECAAFQVVGDAHYDLLADQSQTFSVRMLSETPGDFACALHTGQACGDVALTGLVVPAPLCSLDVADLEFGTAPPGALVTRTLLITNVGGDTLSGSLEEACAAFAVRGNPGFHLAAGESRSFDMDFFSLAVGDFECTLHVGSCPDVTLHAVVEPPPVCQVSATALDFGLSEPGLPVLRELVVTNAGGGVLSGELVTTCPAFSILSGAGFALAAGQSQTALLQFLSDDLGDHACTLLGGACGEVALSGSIEPAPACSLDAAGLDFGTTPPGVAVTRSLTITNSGGNLLVGELLEDCPAFRVVGDASFSLTAGQSRQVVIEFQADSLGAFSCALQAGPCGALPLQGVVEAAPACALDLSTLDFGTVLPYTLVTRGLTITNTGGGTLTGQLSESCAAYAVLGASTYALSAGQSRLVEIAFLSGTPGNHACDLHVGSCGDVALSGTVELAPACALDATSLYFGTVLPGAPVTRSLSITNSGGGVLTGELSESCDAFSIVGDTTYELAAGQSRIVEITFQSDVPGAYACDLHTGSCGDVALSGTVELAPACALDVTSLDFGTVLPGTLVTRSLTITNTGGGVLMGDLSEDCAAFAIVGETTYSLAAGQSRVVYITFQSGSAGSFACDLHVGSCSDVALSGTVELAPACALDVASLDFGTVLPGMLVTRALTISNSGGGILSGELSETCDAFSIVGDLAYELVAGQSRVVDITFQSDSSGTFACDLHVGSCGDVALSGVVELAPACALDVTSLDFGTVLPGAPVTRELTITNSGGGVLTGELSESCDAFAIVGDPTYSLAAGQSRIVEVTFLSDSTGTFTCDLHAGSCGDVTLSGAVEAAPICELDVTSLDFGTVLPGTPVTRELTITNTGGGILSGELSESCDAFAIVGDPLYELTAGQSRVVDITFQSDSSGIFACDLHTGACGDIALSGAVEAEPACSLDVTSLDFGTHLPGTPVLRSLSITNTGGGVLIGELEVDCSTFYVLGEPTYQLSAGQSQNVELIFSSDLPGAFSCTLSTGPCGDVALSGVVELAPACALDVTSLDFGNVLPGSFVTRSLTITNTGGGTLVGELVVDCAAYSIVGDPFYELAAGQSRVVEIAFQSDSTGTFACGLHAGSCDVVTLSGTALSVSVATGPASACGLVEDLGHQAGATTGFLVDWNAGLVGLNITPTPVAGLTVAVLVDGASVWMGPTDGAWRAQEVDLSSYIGENRVIHLTLSDGQQTWNATGEICAWDLRFADLAEALPMAFQLHEAAPNPFNPTTRLRLDLPLADRVELRVLDIQGRLVETLFSGDLPAGRHDFTWQPARAASGAYFVVARGARDTQVRKVLYLK